MIVQFRKLERAGQVARIEECVGVISKFEQVNLQKEIFRKA